MKTISYLPLKDKLSLKLRTVKGKPTKEVGRFKLWWNKQGVIYALDIDQFLEELKEFEKARGWIQLGGIWKNITITRCSSFWIGLNMIEVFGTN
ncbi:MAG: hypothetical protein AB1422_06660 [bacterium]